MIIKNIFLQNFGPLRECEIQFKKGLNIITGVNGVGKTQLFGAIAFCVFGPKVLRIEKGSQFESFVRLTCEKDRYQQIVEYKYSNGQFIKTFIDKRNTLINDPLVDNYENFLYKYKPLFTGDTTFIEEIPNKQDFDFVTNLIADNTRMRETWDMIKGKYESQINGIEGKKIIISSMGEEWLLKLIKRLLLQIKSDSPIIIDEAFIYLDENHVGFILRLLEILSQNKQIILFSSPYYIQNENLVYSITPEPRALSSISYDYRSTEKIVSLSNNEVRKKEENPVIVRYILGTQLEDEEYRQVEFKELKGQNPIDSIKNTADEYVVAFLNDYTKYKGRIIWGVTDKERKVVGVKLEYSQRDFLRRVVTEKLSKINPSIPPSSYVILLQPVYDTKKSKIKDLFVVEILVEITRSQYLYATASNEVFIKTDGGKKRLTSMEIQQEVLRRKGREFTA